MNTDIAIICYDEKLGFSVDYDTVMGYSFCIFEDEDRDLILYSSDAVMYDFETLEFNLLSILKKIQDGELPIDWELEGIVDEYDDYEVVAQGMPEETEEEAMKHTLIAI